MRNYKKIHNNRIGTRALCYKAKIENLHLYLIWNYRQLKRHITHSQNKRATSVIAISPLRWEEKWKLLLFPVFADFDVYMTSVNCQVVALCVASCEPFGLAWLFSLAVLFVYCEFCNFFKFLAVLSEKKVFIRVNGVAFMLWYYSKVESTVEIWKNTSVSGYFLNYLGVENQYINFLIITIPRFRYS